MISKRVLYQFVLDLLCVMVVCSCAHSPGDPVVVHEKGLLIEDSEATEAPYGKGFR